MNQAILATTAPDVPKSSGKVRDVYDLGDRLVLVATDRISAFDWVLPNGVPGKGVILTQLSLFWFKQLGEPNHLLSTDLADMGSAFASRPEVFAGRSMLVRKLAMFPVECVARGYLAGSGWKEYRSSGAVCGERLPAGLRESDRLPAPIFTPATKAMHGHDENISFEQACAAVGAAAADELRRRTLSLYARAADHAQRCGVLLADTKFEFGADPSGAILLADEALTPDSSRYWPADGYAPGGPQPSYDKQFVRDWLESVGFDKQSPPPAMPAAVVAKTRAKYIEAYTRLVGSPVPYL